MGDSCPHCGFENPSGFQFCGQCGKSLAEAAGPQPPAHAERRHLTVMFCDLVSSTELSERLDPEEFRDVVRDYQAVCGAVIDRFSGHIAQHLGDGLMVYFGYPAAHEDDPQRAVHAGLGIVGSVRDLSRRLQSQQNIELQVRVGIHTGDVITGEVGSGKRREQLALGRAPNVAARLQTIASPNSVILSDEVHRLVHGFFACESLGKVELKGIAEATELFRVMHSRGVRSRFEIAVREGLSPVVGREEEFGVLRKSLARATDGHRTTVLVTGDPGIGKSRLIEAFRETTEDEDRDWVVGRCSSFYANSPLNPLIDVLARAIEITPEDDAATRLERLHRLLAGLDMDSPEVVPLLADLLSIPAPGHYTPLGLSSELHKQRVLETLVKLLVRRSEMRPVIFMVEDIHWADPSTLECLKLLLDTEPHARVLCIFAFRPSFDPPWAAGDDVSVIKVDRLTDAQVRSLVAGMTRDLEIPEDIIGQIVDKTDGVPIFVEELTKMVVESGLAEADERERRESGALQIPTTLQDSLVARLDRLGDARDTALLAAVLGREFPFALIEAISEVDPGILRRHLEDLVNAELLVRGGADTHEHLAFRHALIQDAAYGLLLKTTRREYHRRVGETVTNLFPQTVELHPEVVAHHFTEAELHEPAAQHWLLAAARDRKLSANAEAIQHATRGLEVLAQIPTSSQRDTQEMMLQSTLGGALMAGKGYSAPDVQSAFARAVEIGSQLGDNPQIFVTTVGLWMYHVVRGDYDTAIDLAQRLVRLAESLGQPAMLIMAHYAIGFTSYHLGDLATAQSHFERALAVDVGDQDVTAASPHGDDPRVHVSCFLALAMWQRGLADQAREQIASAMELAKQNGNPYGQAFATVVAAWAHYFLGEYDAVVQRAREGLAIATEKGFPYWQVMTKFILSWAPAWEAGGDPDSAREGVTMMRKVHQAYRASGARLGETLWLSLLVATLARAGLTPDGLAAVDESFVIIGETGERSWQAEFYRLQGELYSDEGDTHFDEAEASFERALEIARAQGALSFELRAAMSLGRLWHGCDAQGRARQLLTETYDKFSEGFDTADLIAARELIDAWAS